ESGQLTTVDGHYELTGSLSTLTIPATLQDSLMARLDRLVTAKAVAQYAAVLGRQFRSEEHTSELQSRVDLVCRLLLEKKKTHIEKSSGGLAAHYHGSSWATKAKQIHDSLDDVAAKMASSNDKVK